MDKKYNRDLSDYLKSEINKESLSEALENQMLEKMVKLGYKESDEELKRYLVRNCKTYVKYETSEIWYYILNQDEKVVHLVGYNYARKKILKVL